MPHSHSQIDLSLIEEQVLEVVLRALEAHDPFTSSHCRRVGIDSKNFAAHLGLSETDQRIAFFSGSLHDLGKVNLPINILHKPAKLSPFEYKRMQGHAALGEHILTPAFALPTFKATLTAIRHHHERIDGNGYPDRLSSDRIPFLSRLLCVTDSFDAMTEKRPYHVPRSPSEALGEILRCAGTQFDESLAIRYLEFRDAEFSLLPGDMGSLKDRKAA
jgi:HD-GYP domain-containing protein (c-di-GMP phosphodiesterase class II)